MRTGSEVVSTPLARCDSSSLLSQMPRIQWSSGAIGAGVGTRSGEPDSSSCWIQLAAAGVLTSYLSSPGGSDRPRFVPRTPQEHCRIVSVSVRY